jgi:hypothetical protein
MLFYVYAQSEEEMASSEKENSQRFAHGQSLNTEQHHAENSKLQHLESTKDAIKVLEQCI